MIKWNEKSIERRADKWREVGPVKVEWWNYVYAIEATWIIQYEIPNFCLF